MEVLTSVEIAGGGRRDLQSRELKMTPETPGVWEYNIDLKSELGLEGPRAFEQLNGISKYTNIKSTISLWNLAVKQFLELLVSFTNGNYCYNFL